MERQERSYELRSEKVRSIVGQIPPVLVRYGTIILFAVLMILLGIAYFMPYKQVYSGTVTFYDISEPTTIAYVTFANDRVLTKIDEPFPLTIHFDNNELTMELTMELTSIESRRDTLGRYPVMVRISAEGHQKALLQNGTFDFTLVESSQSLLSHFLSK